MLKFFKITGIVLLSIILLFFIFVGGMNIFKHFYYKEYYSILVKAGKIAGINEGFIPQGITYYDNNSSDGFFVSAGYMSDGSASRIYSLNEKNGQESYFSLTSGGEPFFGHTGGLQYENGFFYLADEGSGLYKFSSNFLENNLGNTVEIGYPTTFINNTSFVFTQSDFLYVGEFNNNKEYACNNSISYNGKNHNAIVTKYNIDNLSIPVAIYSIPDEIQGFCMKDDGSIILSRSYSVDSSNFLIYEPESIISTNLNYMGAPVYFLNEPSRNINGPAMSEDLDIHNGNVITIFESACNKYFFGKLFFANYIAELKF